MAGNPTSHNISGMTRLRHGEAYFRNASTERGVPINPLTKVEFGAPATADADGVAASQAVVVATTPLAVINGALASGGVATFDVPRNVVAAWTGTAVLTVTGTDQYGNTLVESSASGTSLAGKKAFKTVTSASFSANVTAATIGSGDVLGLPYRLTDLSDIVSIRVGGVAEAATVVIGDSNTATATTGDVRGTIDFTTAMNGSVLPALWASFDPSSKTSLYGVSQFAG